MKIWINQEEVISECHRLSDLLKSKSLYEVKGQAIAINGRVIPKADIDNIVISDGDRILIVKATQGG
ncbi:MAG: sulfur carrier protein ThiS [Cyclobacteriaceae bacterium]|nr:sulfur carrier protein ThiS [Cyclobacteriaceae bacterium]MCH8517023.1 sulfur carrier protein ThiS [Cyclobacteriaceae bacterium]